LMYDAIEQWARDQSYIELVGMKWNVKDAWTRIINPGSMYEHWNGQCTIPAEIPIWPWENGTGEIHFVLFEGNTPKVNLGIAWMKHAEHKNGETRIEFVGRGPLARIQYPCPFKITEPEPVDTMIEWAGAIA